MAIASLEAQTYLDWEAIAMTKRRTIKVTKKLAADLRGGFLNIEGLYPVNTNYMRNCANKYLDELIVQQLAAQIACFHNRVLLDKVKGFSRTNLVYMRIFVNIYRARQIVQQLAG